LKRLSNGWPLTWPAHLREGLRLAVRTGGWAGLISCLDPCGFLCAPAPGLGRLSAGERELVTLVARGRTDAQIAAELVISVRTVSSRLDRIRDKTGCRRRAELTRLALAAGWSSQAARPGTRSRAARRRAERPVRIGRQRLGDRPVGRTDRFLFACSTW
jgi:DNA-binding CsgD family transcriptional regulator